MLMIIKYFADLSMYLTYLCSENCKLSERLCGNLN